MDVTCDRCGTEYEFEEALVSTRGTTVKCTDCGHLFKVYKPEAPAEADAAKNPWTIRRSDGSIHRLSSLADLTRLIEEGAFGRDDELSRTSKAWKRLGDIEELGVFFARAQVEPRVRTRKSTGAPRLGQRKAPPAPGARNTGETMVGRLPGPGAQAASAAQAAATLNGVAPPAAASVPSQPPELGEGRASVPPPRPMRAANDVTVSRSDDDPRDADVTTAMPASRVAPPDPLADDGYEPFARRKAPLWLWVFVIVASVGAFGTWLLWPMFGGKRGAPVTIGKQDPAIEFLARADIAFATHREQRFEDALSDYTKALAFHENDPHVLSSIARVYGVWAQEQLTRAEVLARELGDSPDVERRSQLLALNKQAREHGEQAKRYAENAARKNPGNEEAEVALSDALRLTGNLVAARSELDRARTTESSPSGETLRVAALLAIAEAGGDLRAGLPLASQAVAQDPDLIRARLLLARCLLADGDVSGARYHLAEVSTKDRSHPGVLAIEQEMAHPQQPKSIDAAPAPEPPDSGLASNAKGPDRDKDRDKDKDPEGSGYDNLSHEAYISRGQKLLEAGQVTNAKRMFEQALFIRPNSTEAHAGLGFVALEKGRPKLAVEHFNEAKRGGNAEALIGLGDAYRRLGRNRDALRAYQTYMNEHPKGAQISIARAQVERLSDEASANKK
ncbi:MAG TPA: tetratricopeptide repeat protein [Polyangiales bacterium]|nr:tetratricopeptide repeat protein [Polyangiales bacterium]